MLRDCTYINFWSLLIRLPDDIELRIIDGSNDDEIVYEGNNEDMDLPLKYYRDYYVEGIYPGIVTIIYLREARW
jgi:hypothetical protein